MTIESLSLSGVLLIHPDVFVDARGKFFESFSHRQFEEAGLPTNFVQDNQSVSEKGTFRGLHLQAPPFGQGKLVRVTHGVAIDVVVDVRKASPTFGKHLLVKLSAQNDDMLWVPEGFAHGFLALRKDTVFQYKCTGYYNKEAEVGLLYTDSALDIELPVEPTNVSEKDLTLPTLAKFVSPY